IGGPDASFSLDEKEFTELVKVVREASSSIGQVQYSLTDKQRKGRDFSRSLYVSENMSAGEIISEKNVRSVRPGFGLHPRHYSSIIGKKVNKDLEKGTAFKLDFIAE
ncbi:MAG: SAF domain-containing protein, partial [Flavitalea sp.]